MPNATVPAADSGLPGFQTARRYVHEPHAAPPFIDPAGLPDLYGMRVAGDCMLPLVEDGAVLHFDKRELVAPGDLVMLFKRPELVVVGELQARVKRLVLGIPEWVTFPWVDHPGSDVAPLVVAEMLNPPRQFAIKCSDLLAVHKCVAVVS